jgi:Uma2 family endonuclease
MATVLRQGGPNVLYGVCYDWYVRLRDDPRNGHSRMTYHNGVLEIVSPEFRHERDGARVDLIVRAVASAFDIECVGAGSTTFRRGQEGLQKGHGKEPDTSFYLANWQAVRAKDTIDLEVDPPPDLWVEVDNRVSSRGRLPVYAALEIPEVWRLRTRRRTLWFGRLECDTYVEIKESLSLPMVTPGLVLSLLELARQAPGETTWDRQMRDWLRNTFRPAYEARGERLLP